MNGMNFIKKIKCLFGKVRGLKNKYDVSMKMLEELSSDTYEKWCESQKFVSYDDCVSDVNWIFKTLFEMSGEDCHIPEDDCKIVFAMFYNVRRIISNLDLKPELERILDSRKKTCDGKVMMMFFDANVNEKRVLKYKKEVLTTSIWLLLYIFKFASKEIRTVPKLIKLAKDFNNLEPFGFSIDEFKNFFSINNLPDDIDSLPDISDGQGEELDKSLDNAKEEACKDVLDKNRDYLESLIYKISMIEVKVIELLFVLLNCKFISCTHKDNVIGILRATKFAPKIQKMYDEFSITVSNAYTMELVDTSKKIVNKFPKEYLYSANYCKNSMRLKLTCEQINKLYKLLTDGGYISSDESIIDFGFALVGKPHTREEDFTKIDWKKTKIALLTLLGELGNKPKKEDGKEEIKVIYWAKIVSLFTWRGENIAQEGLSDFYRRPRRRNSKEVIEIKNFVSLIKSTKE